VLPVAFESMFSAPNFQSRKFEDYLGDNPDPCGISFYSIPNNQDDSVEDNPFHSRPNHYMSAQLIGKDVSVSPWPHISSIAKM